MRPMPAGSLGREYRWSRSWGRWCRNPGTHNSVSTEMRHIYTHSLPVNSLVARSNGAALALGALAMLILFRQRHAPDPLSSPGR